MYFDVGDEFFSWIRGGLLILFLYHLLVFIQNRKKVYLYYSLFVGFQWIFLIDVLLDSNALLDVFNFFDFTIQFFSAGFYTYLAICILKIQKRSQFLNKLFSKIAKSLFVLGIVFPVVKLYTNFNTQLTIFYTIMILLTLCSIIIYFKYYFIKEKEVKYFIFGSLIYIIFANIALFISFFSGEDFMNDININPTFFIYIGAILESFIFAIIIGYISKKEEDRRVQAELQLAINSKELEKMKMTALRSQMNPHFLFNSLNSINNFIIQNDVEKASDYITKFSRLIREILNNSSKLIVSLKEELDILNIYIKIEQLRVRGGFEYELNISPDIDLNNINIPPLFLQPYIENAIWHGLVKAEDDKKITLNIFKEDSNAIIEIIDNGIGVEKSLHLKKDTLNRKKSFGTFATKERIKLLFKGEDIDVNIIDLKNFDEKGTKVTMSIPLEFAIY
ncbi:sensor histidine kinase [Aureivirga sp. CE67]|uniref:sensor histidine kinase n=1 Tax=Aureivirga sp. CE67 TaxID=1788983 RepID=UPI0018C9AF5E|nr:histidine kinase [Aureivirga sp. CE67]